MTRRPENVVIVGAGGFGREVADIARDMYADGTPIRLVGYLDDGPVDTDRLAAVGGTIVGPTTRLCNSDVGYVIAIGSGAVRRSIVGRLGPTRATPTVLLSPRASAGSGTTIGPGCIVAAGARLTTGCRLGRHVDIHINAAIGHDCIFDDYSTVFPGGILGGDVHLGEASTVGAGAVVLRGLTIGADAIVGAGAVVTRDVPPGAVVVGAPARSLDRLRSDW